MADEYPLVMSMYLAIMSRVLLSSQDVFSRALSSVALKHNKTEEVVLGNLLDQWLQKMPNVSQRDYTKLLGN